MLRWGSPGPSEAQEVLCQVILLVTASQGCLEVAYAPLGVFL